MRNKALHGLLGVAIALLIGAIIMLVQGYQPILTYKALFDYSLFGYYPLATTLKNSVPLILTGLSASIAFASGVVNLGQPGQLVMGALFATVGGLYLDLPLPFSVGALLLLAMLGGMLWSAVAAVMRYAFNMSEFIVTLMLNMIADFFTYWAITYPFMDRTAYSPMTPQIHPNMWLGEIGGFNLNVFIMLAAFAVSLFVFYRWKAGYEWRISGQNSLFARIGGCAIRRNYLAVMLFTGALAGLAGGLVVMSGPHRFIKGLGANYAWDGVMIAVVANNDLIATLFYGLFFATLQTGALGMELVTAVPSEFIMILQALMVLVIVAGREYINLLLERLTARRQAKEHAI